MAYSSVADLLTSDFPLPAYISKEKYVSDASDEVDSVIGSVYQTPVFDVTSENSSPVARHSRLLLKRIANHLASGRLILTITASSEGSNVHAYGWSLIKNANDALKAILDGTVQLEGAEPSTGSSGEQITAPIAFVMDAESNVEAFYDRVANPAYNFSTCVSAADQIRFAGGSAS